MSFDDYHTNSSSTLGPTLRRRNKRIDFFKFSGVLLCLVAVSLLGSLVPASLMRVKPLSFQAPIPGTWGDFSPDVKLTAEAVSVDPMSRTIIMNWYPDFTTISCHSFGPPTAIDIYISSTLLDTTSPSWSSQLGDQPAYRLNSTETCFGLISAYPSFRTVTKLIASKNFIVVQAIAHQSTFQNYPFDVYLAPFLFYTRNVETGVISPLEISDSFGIAVNFEISLLDNAQLNQNGIEDNIQFFLRVERSVATKAFVVLVGITNWLIAIAFLIICSATVVYRPHNIYSEMFVVPVGALFAFSSIRANLPGAPPGFGATIDIFTIFPVLIIMSLCSFALLLTILYLRIAHEQKQATLLESKSFNDSIISSTSVPDQPQISTNDVKGMEGPSTQGVSPIQIGNIGSAAPAPKLG